MHHKLELHRKPTFCSKRKQPATERLSRTSPNWHFNPKLSMILISRQISTKHFRPLANICRRLCRWLPWHGKQPFHSRGPVPASALQINEDGSAGRADQAFHYKLTTKANSAQSLVTLIPPEGGKHREGTQEINFAALVCDNNFLGGHWQVKRVKRFFANLCHPKSNLESVGFIDEGLLRCRLICQNRDGQAVQH